MTQRDLLRVVNLKKHFPIASGGLFSRQVGRVKEIVPKGFK